MENNTNTQNEHLLKKTKKKLFDLITGRASKRVHGLAVMCVFVFFFSACLIAQRTFIGGYSIYEHTVSSQGNDIVNPDGYRLFNLAIIATGFMLIPHFIYLYRRLMPTSPLLTQFFIWSGITGCFGLVLLGFYPSTPSNL